MHGGMFTSLMDYVALHSTLVLRDFPLGPDTIIIRYFKPRLLPPAT